MNVDSLKSELQQVLDNDVILRKEFNVLKRSLSDYRNQLIMRDEDCKRLQVTIDVLNTKLVVIERDNTGYKAELATYKELRGTINDQLQAKQDEIDNRLQEIQALKDDLNTMAANYEAAIELIKLETSTELEKVKTEYVTQLAELRSHIHYKENGIKEEYENRLTDLTNGWSDKEQSLTLNHEEEIERIKAAHASEINTLTEEFTQRLSGASESNSEEVASMKLTHQLTIAGMEEDFNNRISALDLAYQNEITNLKGEVQNQQENLNTELKTLRASLLTEYSEKEQRLVAGYEGLLQGMTQSHSVALNETISDYESRISGLVVEYEGKLSNTLIHSNSQNSKLNDELGKAQSESDETKERISDLTIVLDAKTNELTELSAKLQEKEGLLAEENNRLSSLQSEFDAFKAQAALSGTEQVNELNLQIAALNLSHSDYANELTSRIEELDIELKNLGLLFESTTNTLSETEVSLELKIQELQAASTQIEELNAKLNTVDSSVAEKEEALNAYKLELQETATSDLKAKSLEFEKLLAENTNLIDEINIAQDKVDTQETEICLLKGELDEVRLQSIGKSEYFKETLSNKNFQITNLEANNAALNHEVVLLKKEIAALIEESKKESETEMLVITLQNDVKSSMNDKMAMQAEIDTLYTILTGANDKIAELEGKVLSYESEIETIKKSAKVEEQEAFIDRLFKQIDELNDQKLALLDEKEQMANQLLKMNEVVGSISQQVEAERIDVTNLNNHRKNVILANNSNGTEEKSPMKQQINDLVREIDKCIELLSA